MRALIANIEGDVCVLFYKAFQWAVRKCDVLQALLFFHPWKHKVHFVVVVKEGICSLRFCSRPYYQWHWMATCTLFWNAHFTWFLQAGPDANKRLNRAQYVAPAWGQCVDKTLVFLETKWLLPGASALDRNTLQIGWNCTKNVTALYGNIKFQLHLSMSSQEIL